MSNPTNPQSSSSQPPPDPQEPYAPFFHGAAIAAAVLCPIALLLPSRTLSGRPAGRFKPTIQNLLLGSGAFWGFDRLAADYTGQSITARSAERWGAIFRFGSSNKNPAEAEAGAGAAAGTDGKSAGSGGGGLFGQLPTERAERNRALMEAERKRRAEAEGREYKPKKGGGEDGTGARGWWRRVWMGGEKDGWLEKRMEEERRALESGKGYGDLIAEQVKEVWNGEGKKEGEEKGRDGKK